jgi:hypothetical protein
VRPITLQRIEAVRHAYQPSNAVDACRCDASVISGAVEILVMASGRYRKGGERT